MYSYLTKKSTIKINKKYSRKIEIIEQENKEHRTIFSKIKVLLKKIFNKLVKRNKIKYKELPKFPEVRRDLAILLDESVTYADLRKRALRAGKKLLKNVSLFDVYRGEKIPEGKKQYALGFVLQDLDKTLTDNDVERVMSKLLSVFQNEFGAVLR